MRRYVKYKRSDNRTAAVLLTALLICAVLLAAIGIIIISDENGENTEISAQETAMLALPFCSDAARSGAKISIQTESYIDKKIASMSDYEKVGQLLLLRSNGLDENGFCTLIKECSAGGAVIFANDIADLDAQGVKDYIASLQRAGGGKLLICADEEGGTVVRVSSNSKLRSSKFKSPQSIYKSGGMDAIGADAAEKSAFLLELGINVNLAPVADVVTEKEGFLFSRAFGQGAEATAEYVKTVVSAMNASGIGCSLKHFPGYGNSSGDTHEGLVYVDTPRSEIESSYLLPFRAGIEASVGSVMVTHSIMTSIDANRPCSLSETVISVLRNELSFNGVIITDGMDMGAVIEYAQKRGENACVLAFEAGCDLICTPDNAKKAHSALLAAVESGRISEERLNESLRRILLWKFEIC